MPSYSFLPYLASRQVFPYSLLHDQKISTLVQSSKGDQRRPNLADGDLHLTPYFLNFLGPQESPPQTDVLHIPPA